MKLDHVVIDKMGVAFNLRDDGGITDTVKMSFDEWPEGIEVRIPVSTVTFSDAGEASS
jgi:hypothetical protein